LKMEVKWWSMKGWSLGETVEHETVECRCRVDVGGIKKRWSLS